MKGVPWRPVLRLEMIRCEHQDLWRGRCLARATRFFVWNGGRFARFEQHATATCEEHAARRKDAFVAIDGIREMSREEWEVCRVQES